MSDIAISVQNLSKLYTIGATQQRHDTLRDALVNALPRISQITRMKKTGNIRGNPSNPWQENDTDLWALRDVSFDVKQGEVVGIIGRNGAGKSTLLKILSRITEPTSGRVELHGRVASLLEVGTGFHPELTGRENIYLNGAILGMKRREIDRKFDEIVAFAEIERFLDTPVKRYSSGMYVRLAFAVAAHLEPEILLVDEVLAVGDASFQKKCLGKMSDVAGEGRTVVFVSHQLAMIGSLCKSAILFERGSVIDSGSAYTVINNYATRFAGSKHSRSFIEFERYTQQQAQILSAALHDQDGDLCSSFDVFDPVELQVTYIIYQPIEGVGINLVVKRNGEILFVSFDTDATPEWLGQRKPGSYMTSVQLPCPLKAGQYAIDLSIGRMNVGGVDVRPEALTFDVEERSFDTSMRAYASRRPGAMAAHLRWMTQKTDELILV